MNKKNKIIHSFGAQSIGTLITIADRLLVVPILYWYLPLSIANLYIVLRTIPAYMSSADLGLASEVGNRMTKYVKRKREYWALVTFTTGFYLILKIGLFIAGLYVLWINIYGIQWIETQGGLGYIESFLLLVFVGGYAILINHTQLANAGYRSVSQDYRGIMTTNYIRIAEFIFFVLVVAIYKNIVIGAFVYFVVRLVGNIYIYKILIDENKWINLKFKNKSKKIGKKMVVPALAFASLPIGFSLQQQIPITLLAIFGEASMAAGYAITQILCKFTSQFGMQITRSIWPKMSQLGSSEKNISETEKYWDLHDKAVVLGVIIGGLIMISIWLFGEVFLNKWSFGKIEVSVLLIIILATASYINCIWYISLSAQMAISNHISSSKTFIILVLIALALVNIVFLTMNTSDGLMESAALIVLFSEAIMLIYVTRKNCLSRNITSIKYIKKLIDSLIKIKPSLKI